EVKAVAAEALRDGRLVAIEIRATTGAARRVEVEEDRRTTKTETHWVEFVVTDQNGEGAGGLKYVLTFPDGTTEQGNRPKEGILYKTGVKKGEYRLDLFTLTEAQWYNPGATRRRSRKGRRSSSRRRSPASRRTKRGASRSTMPPGSPAPQRTPSLAG